MHATKQLIKLFSGEPLRCMMWVTKQYWEGFSAYCRFIYNLLCPSTKLKLYDWNNCKDHKKGAVTPKVS